MRKTNVGYCADGNGEVFLKDRINIKELKNKLDNLNSSIDYNIENKIILIEEYSFSWNEDRTYAFLNTLKPYVEKGLIEYKSSLSMCLKYRDRQGCNW